MATLLVNQILRRQRALFVGAGCSASHPSNISTSSEIKAKYAKALGLSLADDSPLEVVAEKILEASGPGGLYHESGMNTWRLRSPNINHRIISQLVAESLIDLVVTTNYDNLLERCLDDELQVNVNQAITKPSDFPLRRGDWPTIIKLHGSVIDFQSVKIAKSHFRGWNKSWQKEELNSMLRRYSFIFLAYSASDPHIKQSLNLIIRQTGQNPIWVTNQRKPEIDSMLRSLRINPDHQIECDVEDFLKELRYKCLKAGMEDIINDRIETTARSHLKNDTITGEILRLAKLISSELANTMVASDYLKIFLERFQKSYVSLLLNKEKVALLLFWMSLLKYALENSNLQTTLSPFAEGFHLCGETKSPLTNLGILLIDGSNRLSDESLGLMQSWLASVSADEEGKFPRTKPLPFRLVAPNKLFVLLVGNQDTPPTKIPLTTPVFFKNNLGQSTAVCAGTSECVEALNSGVQQFVEFLQNRMK